MPNTNSTPALRPLSNASGRILDTLTKDLADPTRSDESSTRKHSAAGFMPAVIERLGPDRYSVAHYFEQNGDLVADPDVEFIVFDGRWYPAAITQWCGYKRVLKGDGDGRPTAPNRAAYEDLRQFADVFLRNVKAQQGL